MKTFFRSNPYVADKNETIIAKKIKTFQLEQEISP